MKILITGGSRGIGKAIAIELLKAKHELFIVSKDINKLVLTVTELQEEYGVTIHYFACSLENTSDILRLKERADEINFEPDVLILNAGIFLEGSLTTSTLDDFRQTMDVNLFHVYSCVQVFIESIKKSHYGRIVLIGSTASLESYAVGPLYGVSKWALKGYAVNLRKELMLDKIGVTLVNPGGTLTDLWEGEELEPDRLLDPSDIGKIVSNILLLSKQAVVEEIIIRPMLGDFHE